MKRVNILFTVVAIVILMASCVSEINTPIIDSSTATVAKTKSPTNIPKEVTPPIWQTKTAIVPYYNVTHFSILDDEMKKDYFEWGSIFDNTEAGAYYPIYDNGKWEMRDESGNITIIDNVHENRGMSVFNTHRADGKSYEISASSGSIVMLDFLATTRGSSLFYAPSINQFIGCLSYQNDCFLQPSSMEVVVWNSTDGVNGEITKYFDDSDPGWCVKGSPSTGVIPTLPPNPPDEMVESLLPLLAYILPGDDKVYRWKEGECPAITIKEIK